jgi:hypothetical protein
MIFILYTFISLTGYFYLGNDLLLYDFKNVLFTYGISFFGKFLLNFLTICIVITHMCIKFRTLKQKATILIRNENRDSTIWHIFIITLLHIIQVPSVNIRSSYHVFSLDLKIDLKLFFCWVHLRILLLFAIQFLSSSLLKFSKIPKNIDSEDSCTPFYSVLSISCISQSITIFSIKS